MQLIIIYCTFFVALSSAQIAPYIINGRDALENEFPYIVSLRRTELELFAGYPYHICGGTIIDEVTVVTAAHCLFDMFGNHLSKNGSYFVVAGIVSISSYTATSQMAIAEEIYKHPGYDPEVFSNDIAVLKVSPPFDFSYANVQPIKRAMTNSTYVGQNCSVHGWGTLSYDLPIISDSLKTVDLEIYDHNLCNKTYEGLLSNDQICAYQLGKDSCSGDSGGPLICNEELAGIVSFGFGCALEDFPGVYTKVSSFNFFIENPDYHSSAPQTIILKSLVFIPILFILNF